jgi:sugar fermentation stimulation protein A
MLESGGAVYREQTLGASKLDFLVGNTYLEVKTPLQFLQVDIPDYVKTKKSTPFSSTDRLVRHVTELAGSLQDHQRAILLTCFLYDNPGFKVVERSTNWKQVRAAVDDATSSGVELWQANFEITPNGVRLTGYFRMEL